MEQAMQSTLLCLLFYPHMFVLLITQTGHAYNISEELLQGTLNTRYWCAIGIHLAWFYLFYLCILPLYTVANFGYLSIPIIYGSVVNSIISHPQNHRVIGFTVYHNILNCIRYPLHWTTQNVTGFFPHAASPKLTETLSITAIRKVTTGRLPTPTHGRIEPCSLVLKPWIPRQYASLLCFRSKDDLRRPCLDLGTLWHSLPRPAFKGSYDMGLNVAWDCSIQDGRPSNWWLTSF